MTEDARCPRCMLSAETALHLFRDCPFARDVWSCGFGLGTDSSNFYNLNLNEWLKFNSSLTDCLADQTPWCTLFTTVLWLLWKSRNVLVFQQTDDSPGHVWYRSRKFVVEVGRALTKRRISTRVGKLVKWMRPEEGSFILNTDGAVKTDSGYASAGGLIRDSAGQWVGGFLSNVGSTHSLMGELWGVREGLLLAKSLGLSSVIVEVDAAMVVNFLNGNLTDGHPCSVLVHDAISIIGEGWVKEVRHIFREGNKCADFLANMAQNCDDGTIFLGNPPLELLPLLENDMTGPPSLRI